MLLSDESLFLFSVRRGLVENIAEFAQDSFDSISVIVYLRDHRSFLRSLYSQRVKAGSGSTFEAFLGEMLEHPLYFSRLKHWQDLLGNDSVQVVPYQRELLCERDVVKDFLGRLSLPALENPWGEMNSSLSDAGCEILRRINERYAQAGEDRPHFFRRLGEAYFSGNRPDLGAVLYKRYGAGFDEDLNLLVTGLGLSSSCADALKLEPPPGNSLERKTAGRVDGVRALDTQKIADVLIEAYADSGAKRNEMSWAEILRLVSRELRRRMRHA